MLKLTNFNKESKRYYTNYKIVLNDKGSYVTICNSTFNNCQNLTMGSFCNFINLFEPREFTSKLLEIKELDELLDKPLLVVDVKRDDYLKMRNYLPIRDSLPYISTNGNSMVIVLINFSRMSLKNFKQSV